MLSGGDCLDISAGWTFTPLCQPSFKPGPWCRFSGTVWIVLIGKPPQKLTPLAVRVVPIIDLTISIFL